MKGDNSLSKDVKMMMLKFYILRSISGSSKANPYAIVKRISEHQQSCSSLFGSKAEIKDGVYNAISCLEHSGYIKASQRVEKSRLKKYYTLTKSGKDVLESTSKLFKRSIFEMAAVIDK